MSYIEYQIKKVKIIGIDVSGFSRKRRSTTMQGAIGAGTRHLIYGSIDDLVGKQEAHSKTDASSLNIDDELFRSNQRQVQF